MLAQTFSSVDLPLLIGLIFLEGLLSVDNALVMALIIKNLPSNQRQKALFTGIVSSIVLRALAILSAAYLIQLNWIKTISGLYLLYLSLSHIFKWKKSRAFIFSPHNFWAVVGLLELVDFIFAIDSILAGLAFLQATFNPSLFPSKLWILYFGGVAGLILIRFWTKFFVQILRRFPRLEIGAYCIIGLIGFNLVFEFFF